MEEKFNIKSLVEFQDILKNPDNRNTLIEQGYLSLVPRRVKREPLYQPTEKLIEMLEKRSGEKYCRQCLQLGPKDFKRRILFRNLLTAFEQNGFGWEGSRACPHKKEQNPRKPHTVISSGTGKVALELIMGRRYSADHEEDFERFETYHDIRVALCCVEDPEFMEWLIPKAEEYPRIYFVDYADVVQNFETSRAFQAGQAEGIELEMLLLFEQKDGDAG